MDTALEFVTLGEAHRAGTDHARARPHRRHPHRRPLDHRRRRRRPGMVAPRPQVCTSPVHRPARTQHLNPRARRRSALGGLIDPAGPRTALHDCLGPPSRGPSAALGHASGGGGPRAAVGRARPAASYGGRSRLPARDANGYGAASGRPAESPRKASWPRPRGRWTSGVQGGRASPGRADWRVDVDVARALRVRDALARASCRGAWRRRSTGCCAGSMTAMMRVRPRCARRGG